MKKWNKNFKTVVTCYTKKIKFHQYYKVGYLIWIHRWRFRWIGLGLKCRQNRQLHSTAQPLFCQAVDMELHREWRISCIPRSVKLNNLCKENSLSDIHIYDCSSHTSNFHNYIQSVGSCMETIKSCLCMSLV